MRKRFLLILLIGLFVFTTACQSKAVDTVTAAPPTHTPIPPTATLVPPALNAPQGYFEQPPYAGDCKQRPANSICLRYEDGYIWLIYNDSIVGSGEVGSWEGKSIRVAFGQHADYYHILDTNLVMQASK